MRLDGLTGSTQRLERLTETIPRRATITLPLDVFGALANDSLAMLKRLAVRLQRLRRPAGIGQDAGDVMESGRDRCSTTAVNRLVAKKLLVVIGGATEIAQSFSRSIEVVLRGSQPVDRRHHRASVPEIGGVLTQNHFEVVTGRPGMGHGFDRLATSQRAG